MDSKSLSNLIVPLIFGFLITLGLQYFFAPRSQETTGGGANTSFIVPTGGAVVEPLNTEVDFIDNQPSQPEELTEITTPHSVWTFSNHGAILQKLYYKRETNGKELFIETISPSINKEKGAFLVALNGIGKTPYYYNLVDKQNELDATTLVYKAETPQLTLTKQFKVSHDLYMLDLTIIFEPKALDNAVRLRLFYPAPVIADATAEGIARAVYYSDKEALLKKPVQEVLTVGKNMPSLFGLEDHYFINILTQDTNHFAAQAYFTSDGAHHARAVLQSSSVKEKATWHLRFYCGPKEFSTLAAVDKKLTSVVDYGWFTIFARPLLYLLNLFYKFLKNYGLAIIALTCLIKLLLAPATASGARAQKKQAEVARKLQYIEQKYKHDPQLLAHHKAEFAKKHGIPGMLGCLPLLAQIPIFIGLNKVLANAIELYKAPFLWIPDLSARDPYYIFPLITGMSMAVMSLQTSKHPRERLSSILMALIITAVTANLSAGLSLFIAVSTFLSVVQNYIQKAFKI